MTGKEIEKYIMRDLGFTPRHDSKALSIAAKRTANLFEDVEPKRVIEFMLDDKPIGACYTHSYGFHTREGRAMREFFTKIYKENENEN
jgi:hypothetical protein|tara:strand:- start:54 stop:317 length:264 start_codon:yes stop_codon:yes gene_type:complete